MQLELIEWIDSFACSSSWRKVTDIITSPITCQSAGFLLHEDENYIVIAGHYHAGNELLESLPNACGEMAIPRVAIISRVTLIPIV